MFTTLAQRALVVSSLLALSGCHTLGVLGTGAKPGIVAECTLAALNGAAASGHAVFTQMVDHVHVEMSLKGLSPGLHGIHVHEGSSCANSGSTAGDHFNPHGHEHGPMGIATSHLGDLGNANASALGDAHLSFDDPTLSLDGADSIIGHCLLVHADPDDLKSQPAGNAGARVACGIILKVSH